MPGSPDVLTAGESAEASIESGSACAVMFCVRWQAMFAALVYSVFFNRMILMMAIFSSSLFNSLKSDRVGKLWCSIISLILVLATFQAHQYVQPRPASTDF